jgi:hypothetical protein
MRNLSVKLEARMSRHRRRRPFLDHGMSGAVAAAGTLTLGLAMGGSSAAAVEMSAAAPVSPAVDQPPRVTGLSNFFDYCQTGATLAVPLFYGIGTSTVNLTLAQFPAEAQPVTNQILVAEAAGPQLFEAMAGPARQFIDGGRTAAGPLAAYNEQFNGGLMAFADGTRTAADALGALVQPADVSLRQFADFLDSLQAK